MYFSTFLTINNNLKKYIYTQHEILPQNTISLFILKIEDIKPRSAYYGKSFSTQVI